MSDFVHLLLGAIIIINELVENRVDTFLMKLVFLVYLVSKFIKFRSVKRLVDIDQVLLNLGQRDLLSNANVNEFVRHNTHLLESKGLNFSSWETLNDPTLLLSFKCIDFTLDKFDDN